MAPNAFDPGGRVQAYWWWWGIAVLLGVLEMVTETFVLLVIGIGCVAGGAVAFAGGGFAFQFIATGIGSLASWFLLRRWMPRRGQRAVQSDRDMLLDVGERVRVEQWRDDGSAQVSYRGAMWTAKRASDDTTPATPGEYRIRRIDGTRLIVVRSD